jgi:hypothetical protein
MDRMVLGSQGASRIQHLHKPHQLYRSSLQPDKCFLLFSPGLCGEQVLGLSHSPPPMQSAGLKTPPLYVMQTPLGNVEFVKHTKLLFGHCTPLLGCLTNTIITVPYGDKELNIWLPY